MNNSLTRRPWVISRIISFVFLASLTVVVGYPQCQAANLSLKYEINADRLSADISGAPLQRVLEELSAKVDLPVFLDSSLKTKEIYAKFENLSLEEGIKRIIKPYSSAITFGEKTTAAGQKLFYVAELKVYSASNKKTDYVMLGKTAPATSAGSSSNNNVTPDNITPNFFPVPEQVKDPARAAAANKKVSYSLLKTQIAQKMTELRQLRNKLHHDQERNMLEARQLKKELNEATANNPDTQMIKNRLVTLSRNNSSEKDGEQLKILQNELDQLRKRFMEQESPSAKSNTGMFARK